MRKIVSGLFVSLDGVAETPEKWRLPFDAETGAQVGKGLTDTDTILLGRRTYLEFADFWPKMTGEVPMADFLNDTPKFIASTTLSEPLSWKNSTLLTGDLTEALTE